MEHRGQVVENVIRRSSCSITRLSKELGITRSTLYHRFTLRDLSYDFIKKVGDIIDHDFTGDFPAMKDHLPALSETVVQPKDPEEAVLWKAGTKYIILLERYNKMLGILAKLANQNTLQAIKEEILHFIEAQEKM